MSNTPIRTSIATIGEARGNPRLYMQGKWLAKAGFEPGNSFTLYSYMDDDDQDSLIIEITPAGERTVSRKRDVPVIDINSPDIGAAFNAADRVEIRAFDNKIVITKARTEKKKASRVLTTTAVALFAGGGLLCQAAKAAGFRTVAAVELEPAYADIWQDNHDGHMLNMGVQDVYEEHLASCRPVGLMTIGLPCEPYSVVRRAAEGGRTRARRDLPPEAHANTGDMFFWSLRLVDLCNPHTLVIECVPGFLTSAAGHVTLRVLARMGYNVEVRIIDPLEYGEISSRKRAIVVGTSFDQVRWPTPCPIARQVEEILLPHDHPDCRWWDESIRPWFFRHRREHVAKGNNFNFQVIRPDATFVQAITKRYFQGQGTNPVVAHPTLPNTYRWLTVQEVRQIQGLPDSYKLNACTTTTGEVLGQGVLVNLFTKIISSVTGNQPRGQSDLSLADLPRTRPQEPVVPPPEKSTDVECRQLAVG